MAEIIDQTKDIELGEDEELGNIEELGTIQEEEVEETLEEEIKEPSFEMPAKFKDKSLEEVVHSYTELEKEYGRRSNEIGELRKLTDEILKQSLQVENVGSTPAPKKKTEVDDLLENPDQVIEDAVSNSPKLKQLEEQLMQAKRDEARKAFETKHPNAYDLVKDPGFQQFIGESTIRQKLFLDAHQNYNYDAASELISLYEQLHKTGIEEAKSERQANRDKALKDAATEKGSSGQSSKKIYRRQDLLKMMRSNPKGYNDPTFQAKLIQAYQEGRVR